MHGVQVWDVEVWGDHFARILEMYEESDGDLGLPIHCQLQADWELFSFDDEELIHRFLTASLGESRRSTWLDSRTPVIPRFDAEGDAADHTRRWEAFRDALIEQNRYFPNSVFDHQYLADLIRTRLTNLAANMPLYRARAVATGRRLTKSDMGIPPRNLVKGGRANPVGIAHLYLSNDIETCMRECRAQFNGDVCVATFELSENISCLDLADLRPGNPFVFGDNDGSTGLVKSLVATQILAALGRELSLPTRQGENQLEYVPTQYLCEFVKSLGVGGVRYRSSLRPEGWNIVLFRPEVALQSAEVRHFHVTDLALSFEELDVSARQRL